MIKLQDFAVQQHVTDRQIQRLLKKYENELEGLYQRKGPNGTWLTEEACEILRGKMKQSAMAVYEPDPQVAQLQAELQEVKSMAKEYWDQLKKKENSMALLIEENKELRLQVSSVARLEADNEAQRAKTLAAEKTAQEAQKAAEAVRKAAEDEKKILEGFIQDAKNEIAAVQREKDVLQNDYDQAAEALEQMRGEATQRLQEAEAAEEREHQALQKLAEKEKQLQEMENRNLWHYLIAPFRKK